MPLPARFSDPYRARHQTAEQIRARGAIGSLNDGVLIEIHGVPTRLIAWPGTGFQTEAVHVLTMAPGQQTDMHSYGLAEEAVLSLQGEGEVFVRGEWVAFRPGDLAFFPPPVEHAVRATPNGPGLIAVAAISPPEFELYEAAGLYNRAYGVINSEAAWFARSNAEPGTLTGPSQLAFHDSDPHVRAENLTVDQIRSGGALFNVYSGAKIDVIDAPMVFVLWPGYGARSTGFHFANAEEGLTTAVHTHPASDEAVVLWGGTAQAWAQGGWHDMEIFDVVLAPCGVEHGIAMVPGAALWGGFAAPPQLDLYARTPYYLGTGTFEFVPFGRLDT